MHSVVPENYITYFCLGENLVINLVKNSGGGSSAVFLGGSRKPTRTQTEPVPIPTQHIRTHIIQSHYPLTYNTHNIIIYNILYTQHAIRTNQRLEPTLSLGCTHTTVCYSHTHVIITVIVSYANQPTGIVC